MASYINIRPKCYNIFATKKKAETFAARDYISPLPLNIDVLALLSFCGSGAGALEQE